MADESRVLTAADARAEILRLTWEIETRIPTEIAQTTNARRLASLRRQQEQATRALSRAVTDFGAAVQDERENAPARVQP